MITRHKISCDPEWYEAFPDVALTPSGKMICVFSECIHHRNRDDTCIVMVESTDRGRTWSGKRQLSERTTDKNYFYNCPRITLLADGRLCIVVDRINGTLKDRDIFESDNLLYFSADDGASWSEPVLTPLKGIVPDKLLVTESGRWIIAAHYNKDGYLAQFMRYSDDQGHTWSEEITVAQKDGLNLCEVSILDFGGGTLVAFMRENSGLGYDCIKTVSTDDGATWGEPINFPVPGCHRPVAGWLHDGRAMITHRYMQGGNGWIGWWTQNFFAALTDRESVLADERNKAHTRIMPIDFDRSPYSDLGYSGWVQFPDDEIYIVNYIVDDAIDKGQIRGYSFYPDEFMLEAKQEN